MVEGINGFGAAGGERCNFKHVNFRMSVRSFSRNTKCLVGSMSLKHGD
jgi:hypothetical protein